MLRARQLLGSVPSAVGTRGHPVPLGFGRGTGPWLTFILPYKHSLQACSIRFMDPVQMNKMSRELVRNHYLKLNPVERDENEISVQQIFKTRDAL